MSYPDHSISVAHEMFRGQLQLERVRGGADFVRLCHTDDEPWGSTHSPSCFVHFHSIIFLYRTLQSRHRHGRVELSSQGLRGMQHGGTKKGFGRLVNTGKTYAERWLLRAAGEYTQVVALRSSFVAECQEQGQLSLHGAHEHACNRIKIDACRIDQR